MAWVRLIPTAPDRTDSRNTVVGGSLANAFDSNRFHKKMNGKKPMRGGWKGEKIKHNGAGGIMFKNTRAGWERIFNGCFPASKRYPNLFLKDESPGNSYSIPSTAVIGSWLSPPVPSLTETHHSKKLRGNAKQRCNQATASILQ